MYHFPAEFRSCHQSVKILVVCRMLSGKWMPTMDQVLTHAKIYKTVFSLEEFTVY